MLHPYLNPLNTCRACYCKRPPALLQACDTVLKISIVWFLNNAQGVHFGKNIKIKKSVYFVISSKFRGSSTASNKEYLKIFPLYNSVKYSLTQLYSHEICLIHFVNKEMIWFILKANLEMYLFSHIHEIWSV